MTKRSSGGRMRFGGRMLVVIACGVLASGLGCEDDGKDVAVDDREDALVDAGQAPGDAAVVGITPTTPTTGGSVTDSQSIYLCSLLTADECEAASDCTKLYGQYVDSWRQCVGALEGIGCVSRLRSCATTPTRAETPVSVGWLLSTTCMPRGWQRPNTTFSIDGVDYRDTLPPSFQRPCGAPGTEPVIPSDAGLSDGGY